MKIRTGFVSNSSSSSFVLNVLKGTTEEEIRAMVEKLVGKMEGFFLPHFRAELVDCIMECKGEKNECVSELKWEKKWLKENPGKDTTERDRLQAMVDDKFDHYTGGFSDNGEGALQYFLCETSFTIDEKDFFMENDAGY